MNSQRGNIKQLLAHSPYYQKFSFTREEYLGLLKLAEDEHAETSPHNSFMLGLGIGVLGLLFSEPFSVICGPIIAFTAIATAPNRRYHSRNLKNLIEGKMVENDYQITKREYIAKTRLGIEKDEEMIKVSSGIWDVIFWCKSAPQIKLRRNSLE